MTELEKLGLDRANILDGDMPEYAKVENKWKAKGDLYVAEIVDKVTNATFADLKSAYEEIDKLKQENQHKDRDLEKANNEITKAQQSAQHLSTVSATASQRLETATNQVSDYTQKIEALTRRVEVINQKNSDINKQLTDLQQDYNEVKMAKDTSDQKLNEFQEKLTKAQESAEESRLATDSLTKDVNGLIDAFANKYGQLIADGANNNGQNEQAE